MGKMYISLQVLRKKIKRGWETLSYGYDSIATFVDTFTKQAHFVPCTSKISAEELSRLLYFNSIFKHHGLSICIISDRDLLFTSTFWRDFMRQLRTKLNMSAYHPQIDGQSEQTHRTIEPILRGFIHAQHHDLKAECTLLVQAAESCELCAC